MKEGYAERVKQMTRSLEQLQAGKFAHDVISIPKYFLNANNYLKKLKLTNSHLYLTF